MYMESVQQCTKGTTGRGTAVRRLFVDAGVGFHKGDRRTAVAATFAGGNEETICVARDMYVRTTAWIAVTCRFSCSEGMKGVPIDGFVYVESGDDLKKKCWLRCSVFAVLFFTLGWCISAVRDREGTQQKSKRQ